MKRNYSETEEILRLVRDQLKEYGAAPKEVTAASLCVEEILYRYSGTATPDTPVLFEVRRNSRELAVIVRISGEEYPQNSNTNDYPILEKTVKNMNFRLSHKYVSGVNTDHLVIERYSGLLGDLKFTLRYMGKNKKIFFY